MNKYKEDIRSGSAIVYDKDSLKVVWQASLAEFKTHEDMFVECHKKLKEWNNHNS